MLNLDLLLPHPKEFVQGFSYHYPVPEELLAQYEDVFDWTQLSRNTAIKWSPHILEKFKNNWNWGYRGLSTNAAMPWTPALLEQFKDKWSWYHLGWHHGIINNREMLAMCFSRWNEWHQKNLFTVYAFMPKMDGRASSWAEEFFETRPNLNWKMFSAYKGFPWTADFVRKHADKLDWKELSSNTGLPWSAALISEHLDRWDWFGVSYFPTILSSPELIESFKDQINWYAFTFNTERKWNSDLLVRFRDKLPWARTETNEGGFIVHIEGLYNHASILWTPELYKNCSESIERYFAGLAETEKELLTESNFILLKEDEHWTVYQDGSNWSEDYLKMLIDLGKAIPEKKFINWKLFGFLFKGWNTVSKEVKAYCLVQIDLYDLTLNQDFPWHNHLETFHQLAQYDKDWYGWVNLSGSQGLKPTEGMLMQFEDNWDWALLSGNLNLTLPVINKFKDRWTWSRIFRSKAFTTELTETYPEYWKIWWREMNDLPFDNYNTFARMLRIPTEGNIEQHVTPAELEEFFTRLTDKSELVYRNEFENALREKDFDRLTPSITYDHYYALLIEYANEITSQEWPARFAETLAWKALRLLMQKKYAESIELFKLCLRMGTKDKILDVSIYCNALYVLQKDNTGLPVDTILNLEFLEKCLPAGPQNPAIYFNAACLYMEMNDLDRVRECIQLAKELKYENYASMIAEIKNAPMFSAFVNDNRFNDL
jgi:hypothetical protein